MANFTFSFLDRFQDQLSFKHDKNIQYSSEIGLGAVGYLGFVLGGLFGASFVILVIFSFNAEISTNLAHFSLYFFLLLLFHFLEFYATSAWQPNKLSQKSFLVSHSKAYTIAAVSSWLEYWLESLFFSSSFKHSLALISIGTLLVLLGQAARTLAMYEAGSNFSHEIEYKKRNEHRLVTTGIYSIFRHPSYFGWFYWSIGTQILLCNPICTVGYAIASWSFFKNRIPAEEEILAEFFEEDYDDYRRQTIIGIPFIG